MTDKKEIMIDGVDVKECIFYIDHNPPEGSGTLGGAIHKGACKLNSTDCKDTDECFIKNLYNKLKIKEQECEKLKKQLNQAMHLSEGTLQLYAKHKNIKYKKAIDEIEINILKYQALTFDKPRTMRENDCIYNILDIINKARRNNG